MNYIMLEEAMEQVGWDQQIDARSVYQACQQIEDGRHKRGVRYEVALILTLIVLGKIGGHDDAGRHRAVGALASRLAEQGAAPRPHEFSLCGDLP